MSCARTKPVGPRIRPCQEWRNLTLLSALSGRETSAKGGRVFGARRAQELGRGVQIQKVGMATAPVKELPYKYASMQAMQENIMVDGVCFYSA